MKLEKGKVTKKNQTQNRLDLLAVLNCPSQYMSPQVMWKEITELCGSLFDIIYTT